MKNLFNVTLAFLLSTQGMLTAGQTVGQLTAPPPQETSEEEGLLKLVSKGFSRVAKEAIPAVVYIECPSCAKETSPSHRRSQRGYSENPFEHFQDDFFNRFFGFPYEDHPQKKAETVRGSGFILSPDGYIMTNNHVVDNASKVLVTLHSGRKVPATVVGTDAKTDLAIIKIEEKNLPYLSFGDSDKLEVGDWAIAIGNPFGLQATVTVGVVSAKGRNQLNITDFEDFIQTDAAINPGNSGGPLLDINGKVIGITTAIVSGSGGYMGIGFAIPSNMAQRIKEQLIKDGSVTRGFLGVTLQAIDSELANYYHLDKVQGALITDVVKGSPADQAGLKAEDVILSYNNTPIENLSSFRTAVSFMPPGSKLSLRVGRDGKEITIPVTISTMPEEGASPTSAILKLGIKVQNLTPELAQQFGYSNEKGVLVTQVQPETPAAEVALRPGNLIVAVNRKKVSNVDEFNAAIQEATQGGQLLLKVRQGEVLRFIAITLP